MPAGGNPFTQPADASESRHKELRGEFRKRIQHEIALVQARVRQGQSFLGHAKVGERDQVEVDDARAPAHRRPGLPEAPLDPCSDARNSRGDAW